MDKIEILKQMRESIGTKWFFLCHAYYKIMYGDYSKWPSTTDGIDFRKATAFLRSVGIKRPKNTKLDEGWWHWSDHKSRLNAIDEAIKRLERRHQTLNNKNK